MSVDDTLLLLAKAYPALREPCICGPLRISVAWRPADGLPAWPCPLCETRGWVPAWSLDRGLEVVFAQFEEVKIARFVNRYDCWLFGPGELGERPLYQEIGPTPSAALQAALLAARDDR